MFLLIQLISKLKKISVRYCILVSFALISSLPIRAMDTPSESSDASSGSEEEDYFELVKESENEVLSEHFQFIKNSKATVYNKWRCFLNFERSEENYGYMEERFKTDVINLSAVNRICLLSGIIQLSSKKSIISTCFTIGAHSYKLYLNPTSSQEGNGVLVGFREFKGPRKNGEPYSHILQTLKEIPLDTRRKLKTDIINQKKSGLPISFKSYMFGSGIDDWCKYFNGFNLLLDFEVARRRIDGKAYHKTPLLLCIYYLLDNLHDNSILQKCLSGENYLFGGKKRMDFIRGLLPEIFTKYNLTDSQSIKRFLTDKFSNCVPPTTTTTTQSSPLQKSNKSSESDSSSSELEESLSGEEEKPAERNKDRKSKSTVAGKGKPTVKAQKKDKKFTKKNPPMNQVQMLRNQKQRPQESRIPLLKKKRSAQKKKRQQIKVYYSREEEII